MNGALRLVRRHPTDAAASPWAASAGPSSAAPSHGEQQRHLDCDWSRRPAARLRETPADAGLEGLPLAEVRSARRRPVHGDRGGGGVGRRASGALAARRSGCGARRRNPASCSFGEWEAARGFESLAVRTRASYIPRLILLNSATAVRLTAPALEAERDALAKIMVVVLLWPSCPRGGRALLGLTEN